MKVFVYIRISYSLTELIFMSTSVWQNFDIAVSFIDQTQKSVHWCVHVNLIMVLVLVVKKLLFETVNVVLLIFDDNNGEISAFRYKISFKMRPLIGTPYYCSLALQSPWANFPWFVFSVCDLHRSVSNSKLFILLKRWFRTFSDFGLGVLHRETGRVHPEDHYHSCSSAKCEIFFSVFLEF